MNRKNEILKILLAMNCLFLKNLILLLQTVAQAHQFRKMNSSHL